jgi:hypothetical protein
MNIQDIKQHMEPVTMELGNKERTFQFDMNAFAELEKRFGTIDAAMDRLMSGKIGDVRTILWAALIHEEIAEMDDVTGEPIKYNITPFNIGQWVKTPAMMQEASKKLAAAMGNDMPAPENLPEEVKAQMLAKGIDADALGTETKNAPTA